MISWCPDCKKQYDHNQQYNCPHDLKIKYDWMYIGRKIKIKINDCSFGGLIFRVTGKLVQGNLPRILNEVKPCIVRMSDGSRIKCRGSVRSLEHLDFNKTYDLHFAVYPLSLTYHIENEQRTNDTRIQQTQNQN